MSTQFIIGLTGQSGSGKSSVAKALHEKYGFYHYDCDLKTRNLIHESCDVAELIVAEFGANSFLSSGNLNRDFIARKVFSDIDALDRYNDIVLPYIRNCILADIESIEGKIVLDAPTLIESNLHKYCDVSFYIKVPKSNRFARLLERDLFKSKVEKRLENEREDSFYEENTDFTLNGLEEIGELCLKILVET